MAYPANLAVTNWGSLQSGNTADLDTNFRNLQVGLNGIGNGVSALSSVAISVASIGQANIGGINANSAVFQMATLQTPLPIGSGGTNQTTFANSSVVVITAGSMTGVLPIANGTVLMSNGTAWGPSTVPGQLNPSPITNSLGSDVSLANTSIYFDGPSIAQGNVGTWFVSGTVTLEDTATNGAFFAKLWDGTTVIASGNAQTPSASIPTIISLSGYIISPAGNLKISVRDISNITGAIKFNLTGNSKDSTITAFRIS